VKRKEGRVKSEEGVHAGIIFDASLFTVHLTRGICGVLNRPIEKDQTLRKTESEWL
jgi:hypothetical protein